jgi:hypothetical protein
VPDLHPDLEIWLTEEFVNEEGPSDGELFCKIRQYSVEQRPSLKAKWMARLRGNRKANLKGLLKHEVMTKAFDELRAIPGLWPGMMLTKLHKLMGLHAHKVWHLSPQLPSANVRLYRRVSATSVTSCKSGRASSAVMRGRCGGSTRPPSYL